MIPSLYEYRTSENGHRVHFHAKTQRWSMLVYVKRKGEEGKGEKDRVMFGPEILTKEQALAERERRIIELSMSQFTNTEIMGSSYRKFLPKSRSRVFRNQIDLKGDVGLRKVKVQVTAWEVYFQETYIGRANSKDDARKMRNTYIKATGGNKIPKLYKCKLCGEYPVIVKGGKNNSVRLAHGMAEDQNPLSAGCPNTLRVGTESLNRAEKAQLWNKFLSKGDWPHRGEMTVRELPTIEQIHFPGNQMFGTPKRALKLKPKPPEEAP